MKTINIHEAKTHLSRIIERVARGESVVIGKAGKPMAVLIPFVSKAETRAPGSMKGKIRIPDGWEAEDDLIADLFEGRTDR